MSRLLSNHRIILLATAAGLGVGAGLFNSLYMKCNERRASRPPRVMR